MGRKNPKNAEFLPIFLGGPLLLSTLGGAIGNLYREKGTSLDFAAFTFEGPLGSLLLPALGGQYGFASIFTTGDGMYVSA